MAVPLDLKALTAKGPPVPLIEGIASFSPTGVAHYDVSASGSLVYSRGALTTGERSLVWVDANGTTREVPGLKKPINMPALSPDGTRVALVLGASAATDLWVFDFARSTLTRLTFGEGLTAQPLWTRDGRRIAYASFRNGSFQVYTRSADGGGAEEKLFTGDALGQFPQSWSPDGAWLLYQRGSGPLNNDLWLLPLDGDRASTTSKPKPLVATPFNESFGRLSPDGRWIAYASNESGRNEIYVQPFSGPVGRWQISTDGGNQPAWSGNGTELFYRNGDRIMTVPVTSGASFVAGTPRMLFQGTYDPLFAVARDGQRFLMIKGDPQASPRTLNVVLDWFSELTAKVPIT
jgi:Tol biopolymer transport system component